MEFTKEAIRVTNDRLDSGEMIIYNGQLYSANQIEEVEFNIMPIKTRSESSGANYNTTVENTWYNTTTTTTMNQAGALSYYGTLSSVSNIFSAVVSVAALGYGGVGAGIIAILIGNGFAHDTCNRIYNAALTGGLTIKTVTTTFMGSSSITSVYDNSGTYIAGW